jgi:hypothetical protein
LHLKYKCIRSSWVLSVIICLNVIYWLRAKKDQCYTVLHSRRTCYIQNTQHALPHGETTLSITSTGLKKIKPEVSNSLMPIMSSPFIGIIGRIKNFILSLIENIVSTSDVQSTLDYLR